ncbi:MAG: response regulator transcription factor [Deltaproteobacteria bacterium]|nr:response regulator transcription factor [Deltaproteobacteria bacterium]
MKILYVEDDPTARSYIQRGLAESGFEVDVANDGERGFELASTGAYDLLLLDVMLPERDGFELLQSLRDEAVDTPALFLSARSEVADRIRGLNLGADDYLPKPFAFAELVARIRAIGRRASAEGDDGRLEIADVVVDVPRHRVTRADQEVELTPKEFQIFEFLVRHAGEVVSRTMILERVWGYGFDPYSNLIDVHMNRLRRKVDRDHGLRLIHTLKGVGYILEPREGTPEETG